MKMVNVGSDCSETTVEIKIKMMDSRTFTLRVDKYVPVPQLKEQIASLTGVVSEQQRLICRGKLLTDDQILSAYHVEDGHTLHLVVRQPVAPTPENFDNQATEPTSSDEHNPHVIVGTFDFPEEGDESITDISRFFSAVLDRFRGAGSDFGDERIDLNHPPFPSTEPDHSGTETSSRVPSDQAAVPVDFLQPPIMPDSLTTMLQYASHLSQEFHGNIGGHRASAQNVGFSWSEGSAAAHSSDPRGVLRPESLAEVMSSARQLLVEQANVCLSQLAEQLGSHSTVTDPIERSRIQAYAMRLGPLIQNLGSLLLDLGRTIMTLRMGQTPDHALVCVGPPVFVSPTGPNPIMVQPRNLQPGASFGSVPFEAAQSGHGGSANTTGFAPRNVDIRIQTASPFVSRREPTFGSDEQSRVEAALAAAAPTRGPVTINRSPDFLRGFSAGILHPVSAPTDSATPHQNNFFAFPSGSNMTMLRPPQRGLHNNMNMGGEHFFASNSASAVPSHTSQDTREAAPASGVSDEAIMLPNVLRQIMPIVSSQNTTNEDDQAQADDGNNPDHASSSHRPQSQQPDSKRQRMG